jgi:putative transposase
MECNRTHPAIISYGLYLYFSSRSFRLAAKCLESTTIRRRSHVVIWKWVQKHSCCADRLISAADRRLVKEIFVDETLLRIYGQDCWLWIAYEPNLNRCLIMHLSRERTIFVCYQFFRQLRNRYGSRKPIYTDGARWYNDVCKWLRLKHQIYDTGLKNLMERFVQQIKDRTECFDDHFPCRKHNCSKQHVWNWLKLFILYLHICKYRMQFITFLLTDGG